MLKSLTPYAFPTRMDIHENKESGLVIATFTLPNMRKDDISIDIVDDQLVVSWNTTTQTDVEENGLVIQQSKKSKFSRSILLPPGTRVR
jgi:HSP20 family protein